MITKVDAIEQIMLANGGTASLKQIYEQIEKYYPKAKASKEWEAGLRGVLYRELKDGIRFKKIGLSIYALSNYQVQPKPTERVRKHSFIEGICVELGNFKKYNTYTADPSASYRDNLTVGDFTTVESFPLFTYPPIISVAKRIDVIWFNKENLSFPISTFEVVDSISTLSGAFNRCIQLHQFNTRFFIVAPENHRDKYNQTLELEIYHNIKQRFSFINYDDITSLYDNAARANKIESKIFG